VKATKLAGLPEETPEAISAGTGFDLFLYGKKVWALGNNEKSQLGEARTKHEGPENCETAEEIKKDEEKKVSNPKWCSKHAAKIKALEADNVTTYAWALLEGGVEPPPPAITVTPGENVEHKGIFTVEWPGEAKRLNYKEYERPEGEGLLCHEEGRNPEDVTCPQIFVVEKKEPGLVEGETLRATVGTWTSEKGEGAIHFKVQWRHCNEGSCSNDVSAECKGLTETESCYHVLGAEDVGSYAQAVVTASVTVEGKPKETEATSPFTEIVKAKGAKRFQTLQVIKLEKGQHSVTVKEYAEEELAREQPYELHLEVATGKSLIVVSTIPK
jgi:hypothetical protein